MELQPQSNAAANAIKENVHLFAIRAQSRVHPAPCKAQSGFDFSHAAKNTAANLAESVGRLDVTSAGFGF